MFYILKMLANKEIKEIFGEMLQEHESKKEGILTKHEKLVLKPDIRTSSITEAKPWLTMRQSYLVKTDIEELKESLLFSNINEKVQSLKKKVISEKEDIGVVQTTEPTWALEIRRKLVDLEDRSRKNNCEY